MSEIDALPAIPLAGGKLVDLFIFVYLLTIFLLFFPDWMVHSSWGVGVHVLFLS